MKINKNNGRLKLITFLGIFFIFTLSGCILTPRYYIQFDSKTVDYENIAKYEKVKRILKEKYYKETDDNGLLEGAIVGMTDSLKDPYTVYLDKETMKKFMEKTEGSYVGVGVLITVDKEGLLTIVESFADSPARESGLLKGDKIIKVDEEDVTSIKDEQMVINMIKGIENTRAKITVYRPTEKRTIDFEVQRRKVKISNIESKLLKDNIGYIKIMVFDENIAKYFHEHLAKLKNNDIKGLIIDLRDNPGGSYDQVVEISDEILPEGLIVYTEDRSGKKEYKYSKKGELGLPLAVLINENSASASEILAGAIKDHKKGRLVGNKTFGKGLVQTVVGFKDGSGLKYTMARYFTPNGVCIHGVGIEPDITVDTLGKYAGYPVSQIPENSDLQLQKAIEILK